MARPARPDLQPTEPATKSYAELVAWLHGPPRRSQAVLAAVCSVSQTALSLYASRRARPNPDSEVACLLELATGGRVACMGWLTPDELAERRRRRTRAATFARAIAKGKRLVINRELAVVPGVGSGDARGGSRTDGSRSKKAVTSRTGRRDEAHLAPALPPAHQGAPDPAPAPAAGSAASDDIVDRRGAAGATTRAPGPRPRKRRHSGTPSLPDVILQRSRQAGSPMRGQ